MKGVRQSSKFVITLLTRKGEKLFGQYRTRREFESAASSISRVYTSPSKSKIFDGIGGQQFRARVSSPIGPWAVRDMNMNGDDLFVTS